MPAFGEQEEEMASTMPTATTTTRSGSKATKAASRKTAARSPKARKVTRKSSTSKARGAKAARTRAANQTRAAAQQAGVASRLTLADRSTVLGDYAERAVLIPVGVALTARDRVVSNVNDAISSYSTPAKAQAQLRRFERRGATARNRLEREVRKARVRFERQLRQRRRVFERTVSEIGDHRDNVAKNGSEIAGELANRLQESVLSRV
jgi:hypothetical protein